MKSILNYKQLGFSMIEMVLAIVVSGIMAVGVISFIGNTVDGVTITRNQNQLASAGRIALDRIAMEVHNALPNSIRASTATAGGDQCLEFVPVRAATSYINPPVTGPGALTFDVVDFLPSQHGINGGYAVIFPNRQNTLYAGDIGMSSGWPNFSDRGPIQEIASIADSASADQSLITLVKSHRFIRSSPNQRFFVVEDPISYCIVGENLYRYTNYGFYTTQETDEEEATVCEVASNQTCLPNYDAAPDKMLITDSIDNMGLTAFKVAAQTLTRNSLLALEFNFTSNGDSVLLNHEILTRSVP